MTRPPSAFRRFYSYLIPVKWYFLGAIGCGVYKFLLPVMVAWIFGQVVDILETDAMSPTEKYDALLTVILWGTGLTLVAPIPVYLRTIWAHKGAQRVINDLRVDLFAHVQRLSHDFFDKHLSGSLTSRIISDVNLTQVFLNNVMVQTWMNLAVLIAVVGYFFTVNWKLAILAIMLVPLQIAILRTLGVRIKSQAKAMQNQLSMLSGTTMESLSNIAVVKSFTAEKDERSRFAESSTSLMDNTIHMGRLNGLNNALSIIINNIAPIIVVAVGGYMVLRHPEQLGAGQLVTFVLMQRQIFDPLTKLSEMQNIISEAGAAIERIYEIFDTAPAIADKKKPIKLRDGVRGDIGVHHVTFSYGDAAVLNDISLTIPARTKVALVGPSGSGKSTLAQLIPRFYDIQQGHISLDGMDIRDIKMRHLRRHIGVVPQEPMLFSGTVYDNIAYGNPEATEADVYRSAEMAYADEFIRDLAQGYATAIGENGCRLSGGQKQRLAIARAFLKNPEILILDEATSALDNESEILVQRALQALMKDKTTITIAHRLSTIETSDVIYVMEDGKVAEHGTHSDLLKQQGLYAALVKRDFNSPHLRPVG